MQNFVIDIVVASNIHHNLSNKIFKCKTMDSHCTSLCKVHLFIWRKLVHTRTRLLVLNTNCKINSLFAAQTVTKFYRPFEFNLIFLTVLKKALKNQSSPNSKLTISNDKQTEFYLIFFRKLNFSIFVVYEETRTMETSGLFYHGLYCKNCHIINISIYVTTFSFKTSMWNFHTVHRGLSQSICRI